MNRHGFVFTVPCRLTTSICSVTGINAKDAAQQVSSCSEKVAQTTQAQIKDLTTSVSSAKRNNRIVQYDNNLAVTKQRLCVMTMPGSCYLLAVVPAQCTLVEQALLHAHHFHSVVLQIQSNGLAALQQLDTRLVAIGDALARFETIQDSSSRQSQQAILDALSQTQASLQVDFWPVIFG